MALTPEEIEVRLQAVVDLVTPLLPPDRPEATLGYFALGSFEAATLSCEDPRDGWAVAGSGAVELLRELRRDSHVPESGTWPGLTLCLDPDSRADWNVEPDELEDFRWRAEVTARDCALELERYPRPQEQIPPWMGALLALQREVDAFDPAEILARPRPEEELLDGRDAGYFTRARRTLDDHLPGGGERVLIGCLEEGRWSVVPTASAWLAVRYAGGRCAAARPFTGPREALAHAAAQVMAAEGVRADCELMRAAGVLTRNTRPRDGLDAWDLGEAGREAVQLTGALPRPSSETPEGPEGTAGAEPTIALAPLMNRPGGYFVCEAGPPPETGPYIGVCRVFERALARALPPLRAQPPAPSARTGTGSDRWPAGTGEV